MRMPESAAHTGTASAIRRQPFEPIVELHPRERADEACRKIHRALLERIIANEDGVRSGSAGEYLHDFRVAVRRTRTALQQMKRVHPKREARGLANGFRWLSETTGPARDLEVFLASLDDYRSELGDAAIELLEPLWAFIRDREHDERGQCRSALESDRYGALISAWTAFLDRSPAKNTVPRHAAAPVHGVAADRIERAYARVVRRGRGVATSSPPEAFHRLRLDCKKLRYLLEFFFAFFHRADGDQVVASLRRTQDSLGSINDLGVQAGWTARFADPASAELDALLADRQAKERSRFVMDFAAFVGDDAGDAFRRLLKNAREL